MSNEINPKISENEELQFAENKDVESYEDSPESFKEKRKLLKNTKILKQTWSIIEIYHKLNDEKLILDPSYQRNVIWSKDKQTSFIESILMDIIVPPIYVVEVASKNRLEESKYEVVDGKQRLSAIRNFIKDKLQLRPKALEYFADIYGNKNYTQISKEYDNKIEAFLSSVLDVYVITANSPEFTKYDIFSRLNKGSEKLRVNEIRKAIYQSETLSEIEKFVKECLDKKNELHTKYISYFTKNSIEHYEDFGRFYRSIAFKQRSKIKPQKAYVKDYRSRPRDMINSVLQELQDNRLTIKSPSLNKILVFTLELATYLKNKEEVSTNQINHIIDCCIPFLSKFSNNDFSIIDNIIKNKEFKDTFKKSPSTTINVNKRLQIVKSIIDE